MRAEDLLRAALHDATLLDFPITHGFSHFHIRGCAATLACVITLHNGSHDRFGFKLALTVCPPRVTAALDARALS
jgi:hypothetical protein